jgi:hypothetical protein
MIHQYNIGIKRIHSSHLKLLKVVRSLLERIEVLSIDDQKGFARATTVKTKIEKEDTLE